MKRATALWPETKVQRCAVHKLRHLIDHCPKHARAELKRDFNAIVYAKDGLAARDDREKFLRKWRGLCAEVARSLEEAGDPLLISTRDFYNLDNSYYNYGQDIGNILQQYTNVGFSTMDAKGQERRDDLKQRRWQDWWSENGATFDLRPFLEPARLVDEADFLRRENRVEEARDRYRNAMELVPGYRLAGERLKEIED